MQRYLLLQKNNPLWSTHLFLQAGFLLAGLFWKLCKVRHRFLKLIFCSTAHQRHSFVIPQSFVYINRLLIVELNSRLLLSTTKTIWMTVWCHCQQCMIHIKCHTLHWSSNVQLVWPHPPFPILLRMKLSHSRLALWKWVTLRHWAADRMNSTKAYSNFFDSWSISEFLALSVLESSTFKEAFLDSKA